MDDKQLRAIIRDEIRAEREEQAAEKRAAIRKGRGLRVVFLLVSGTVFVFLMYGLQKYFFLKVSNSAFDHQDHLVFHYKTYSCYVHKQLPNNNTS